MKTTSMIALIAVISAASIGVVSMNGFSAIPFATASVSPESGTMMGHVEYVLYDADGNIKTYAQGDNMVVNQGDNCVIGYVFQPGNTFGTDNCVSNANGFRFIGIGNATATVSATATTLTDTATTVANSSTDGLMAMRTDGTIVVTASSNGGTAVITTESPFTFTSGVNATTVLSAGLFDKTCTTVTNGICTAYAADQNMFSVQAINVPVSGGDSLSVTWTITVGNSS
ncbi:MAG: hypothetical protein AABX32_06555 [Nanoarchaeota archaeon]